MCTSLMAPKEKTMWFSSKTSVFPEASDISTEKDAIHPGFITRSAGKVTERMKTPSEVVAVTRKVLPLQSSGAQANQTVSGSVATIRI